jgi:DNA polymerase-4
MKNLPIGVLAQRFGNPGKRIWYMAQGKDPEKVITTVAAPKSIGHGKVMPPNTRDRHTLLVYLLHMSEKVSARLRRHQMLSQKFYIGLLADDWIGVKTHSLFPTDDGQVIYALAQKLLSYHWRGEGIRQVQITALDPKSSQQQLELFSEGAPQDHRNKNKVMDAINTRYGEFALAPGRLLDRSSMPNVIAPAWKPFGHRKTI